jgi:hypothetical protein
LCTRAVAFRDGVAVKVLTLTEALLVLGHRWGNRLLDMKVIMDREKREIAVVDRLLGFRREGRVPFSAVQSVRMSTRFGRGFHVVPMVAMLRLPPDARRDLWLDLGEYGKIVLVEEYGRPVELADIERMGQRVADFLDVPFVDTSKW